MLLKSAIPRAEEGCLKAICSVKLITSFAGEGGILR